jgi:cytochrome b subunit of formate dehydrogenase
MVVMAIGGPYGKILHPFVDVVFLVSVTNPVFFLVDDRMGATRVSFSLSQSIAT